MLQYARQSSAREFIIGTEMGILYRLRTENPDKAFYPVNNRLLCPNMKKIDLAKIVWALEDMSPRIEVDARVAGLARGSVERMLAAPHGEVPA